MRTVEWMIINKDRTDGKFREFNSVFSDGHGTIYSYGYHYPLLFKLNDKWFVNTKGYSVTTAKHISWAWQAVDFKAYAIKVPTDRRFRALDDTVISVPDAVRWISDEMSDTIYRMSQKKRHDTSVYLNLRRDLRDQFKTRLALDGKVNKRSEP